MFCLVWGAHVCLRHMGSKDPTCKLQRKACLLAVVGSLEPPKADDKSWIHAEVQTVVKKGIKFHRWLNLGVQYIL